MEANHTPEEWPKLDFRWWSAALIVGAAVGESLIVLVCHFVGGAS